MTLYSKIAQYFDNYRFRKKQFNKGPKSHYEHLPDDTLAKQFISNKSKFETIENSVPGPIKLLEK